MRDTVYKYIMLGAMVSIFSILLFTPTSTLAQEPEVAGIKIIVTPGSDLIINIYNYTTKGYDKKITWSNVDLSQPREWILADQRLEITRTSPNPSWGIQIYTDNENNTLPYAKSYDGDRNPAGLVGQITTQQALPMAWIAYADWNPDSLIPDEPVERPYGPGFAGGSWHWLKDLNTPNNEDTEDVDESFHNGEDYVTFWNQNGVAVSDRNRAGNPAKIYVFLAADFSTATRQSYKTNSLTLEHFTDDELAVFPFYLYKDGAPAMQMAYEHISAKMDKYFGGREKRLIESYSDPYPPGPNGSLEGVAFTYDNALAVCAYLARPTKENLSRARLLCKTLIWAQDNDTFGDGRLRDAYDATKSFTASVPLLSYSDFNGATTGNIAWVINALMQYHKNSNDTDSIFLDRVLNAAKAAGEFIHTNFNDPPGYYYGFDSNGTTKNLTKSTEHNIVAYVAFAHLYDATDENKWLTRANNAKDFVENEVGAGGAWNPVEKRYICGRNANDSPNSDALVADTNLLAVLAMNNLARNSDAISYVISHFYNEEEILGLEGIDFGYNVHNSSSEPDGIWFEGTAQLAAAYKVLGNNNEANRYLETIKLAQYCDFWTLPANEVIKPDYKSIVAASKTNEELGLTTGLNYQYYASPSIAATAWFAATKMNYNMLWGTPLNTAVPSPSLIDNNDYLENRYYPSGWMNLEDKPGVVFVDARCTDNPHLGDTCFKIHWTGKAGNKWKWAGIVWQEPENEWKGGLGKGYDLRGADYITFWARTDDFSMVTGKDLQIIVYFGYDNDSCGETIPLPRQPLTTEWQPYIIPVLDRDMSHVSNGFTVMFNDVYTPRDDNKCNIYIDDIEYGKF